MIVRLFLKSKGEGVQTSLSTDNKQCTIHAEPAADWVLISVPPNI